MTGPTATVDLWRFMSKVTVEGDCWVWTGGTNGDGYPTFNPRPGVKVYAARWLTEQVQGRPIAPGTRLRWKCGRTACVRPSHTGADPFWNQVTENADGCWIWNGYKVKGYGRFNGILAHRHAYQELRGDIPDGLGLDHLCRTPLCVNAWHLEPVTQEENNRRKPDTSGPAFGTVTPPREDTAA